MAYFAELNGDNVVTRVIAVGNDISTAAGPLGDNDMQTFCILVFR